MIYDCIILGAGISGISAGRYLQDKKLNILILDKGRSCGGRMATRRIGESFFDHGLKSFTQDSETFGQSLKIINLLEDGDKPKHYFSNAGQNNLAQLLAEKLPIKTETKVIELAKVNHFWKVISESGEIFQTKSIIITFPLPQSLDLLDTSNLAYNSELKEITYSKCLVFLLKLSTSYILFNHPDILAVMDNYQRGVSPKEGSFTIQMSNNFSQENWNHTDDYLIAKFLKDINLDKSIIQDYQVKRWKYAIPNKNYSKNYYFVEKSPFLLLSGDSFGFSGSNLETAFLSGLEAAKALENVLV